MLTIISMMWSLLFCDFLQMYVCGKTLGYRYSIKKAIVFTFVMWMLEVVTKIIVFLGIGVHMVVYVSFALFAVRIIWTMVCFSSSIAKRLLSVIFLYLLTGIMEPIAMGLSGIILGEFAMMELSGYYTFAVVIISNFLVLLSEVFFMKFWLYLEKRERIASKYYWLCIIFPISQYLQMSRLPYIYNPNGTTDPTLLFIGMIVAILADIVMFVLFFRMSAKEKSERLLQELQQQYKLEQLRMQQLKEKESEIAKIRHDFQNYILAIKQAH